MRWQPRCMQSSWDIDALVFLHIRRAQKLSLRPCGAHLQIGTEIVRYGGAYAKRMKTLREHLWGRSAWVVPAGGSSWLGTIGFVNAGLELAEQVLAGKIDCPDRVYVATGTLGTAAGLGLGLAAAGLGTEVHAVRVSHTSIANEEILHRLVAKTAKMMRLRDETVPSGPGGPGQNHDEA